MEVAKKITRTRKKNTSSGNIKSAVKSKVTIEDKIDLILDKIISMDAKIDKLEVRFDTLEARFDKFESQFKGYIKRESDIQEATITEYVYQTLVKNFKTSIVIKHPLRYFYLPSSDDTYTDIDGCLVQTMNGPAYKNNNGTMKAHGFQHAILLEAKHSLTKSLVNYKIQQFCTIKRTLREIKDNTIPEEVQVSSFKYMILENSLKSFPDVVYFFFASDDISMDVKKYIYKISTMTLTKEEYDKVVLDDIKELFNKILLFLQKDVKDQLFRLEFSVDILTKFFRNLDIAVYQEYQQKMVYMLLKSLMPFHVFQSCTSELKGMLGVIQFGKIYQFEEDKDMEDTSLFGYEINQGANLWNFAKI
jgi:hypothetical protein